MKHTTEELLFAAQVREPASSLRHREYLHAEREWEAAQPSIPGRRYNPRTEDERAINMKVEEMEAAGQAFKQKWHAEHPVRTYAKEALGLIVDVADEIQRLRG